jgi:Zn-finger nucleic acid-binding protein
MTWHSLLSLKKGWNPKASTSRHDPGEGTALTCPACTSQRFRTLSHGGFEIHVCRSCRGTYVDSRTLDKLTIDHESAASESQAGSFMRSFSDVPVTLERLTELLAFFASH